MTPEELEAICTKEGPGMPTAERGRRAAARVYLTTKKGRSTYRANQKRATQQEAQDASTLCRWLNAEAAMPAWKSTIPPPPDADEVETVIFQMLGGQNLRHLVAQALVEADADGSITVTGGFTPRHPDWTGLSPLWENAPNTQPMILADRTLQGQPGLVVMHTEEAARLLIEPDDMPLGIIPQGTASHLAGILRHHGARSVRWKSVAEQDGVAGPTDPYTWSSWHYQIPAELMTPPEGWTLSRNLLHTWMIQDVGQAVTLAMYAVNNAEAAVNMAEQAQAKTGDRRPRAASSQHS